MRFSTFFSLLLVVSAALVASACGGSSSANAGDDGAGTGAGGTGQGGTSASGGTSSGSSGTGNGGTSNGGTSNGGTGTGGSGIGGTVSGSGGCGPCLRIACGPPVWLTIVPDVSTSAIADLTVEVLGLELSCNWNGSASSCQWTCQSFQTVPSGHYTATISAPGFETQTVEFDIANPTNCGCCGCLCGGSFQTTVTLHSNGGPGAGCCTSLESDPLNCGACGRACALQSCSDGKCGPAYGSCIAGDLGFTSCDAYCESLDLACTASCGTNGDQAMQEWVGGVANCGADPNITPRSGTCSETFAATTSNGRPDYQCCCEER